MDLEQFLQEHITTMGPNWMDKGNVAILLESDDLDIHLDINIDPNESSKLENLI